MNKNFENIHLHIAYQEPSDDDVLGRDYNYSGVLSVEQCKKVLPSHNYTFYLCGPPPMLEVFIRDLKAWNIPEENIIREVFGAPSVKTKISAVPASFSGSSLPKVTFARSNQSFSWDVNADSLLEFAEEKGIPIVSGCRAGSCGTCLTEIKSGKVKNILDDRVLPHNGSCHMCVSVPNEDVVLDL